jgi:hypothetical protein
MATSPTTRPAKRRGTDDCKDIERPTDLRHSGSLPRYLWLAPKDADWTVIYEAWTRGLDPREVWPDE